MTFIASNYLRNYPNTSYSIELLDKVMSFVEKHADSGTLFWLIVEGIFTPRTVGTIKNYVRCLAPKERRRVLVRLYAAAAEDDSFDSLFDEELHELAEEYVDEHADSFGLTTLMATAFPDRYLPRLRLLPPETSLPPAIFLLLPERWNEEVALSIETKLLHRTRYHPWCRIDRDVASELDMVELLLRQRKPSMRSLELSSNCLLEFLPVYDEFLSPTEAKKISVRRPRLEKLLQNHLNGQVDE